MEEILDAIQAFRVRKGWDVSDTPHILAKSTFVEAGELLECFIQDKINEQDIESELADVLMYALSLAMDLDLDVKTIILNKLIDVDRRYDDKQP